MSIVKIAITVFVNAGGLFEQTKKCAMVDTFVNLTLSLTLVHFLETSGVLFATCISVFIAEYIMKTLVIHKELFNRSSAAYFFSNIKFFVIVAVDLLIGQKIVPFMGLDNIFMWFLSFAVYTIVNGVIILGIYILFHEAKFVKRLTNLVKRKG